MHFAVVVLGDVGRSPRMQYHTLSLLQEGYRVSLVGYEGEDLIPDLEHHDNLHLVRFHTSSPIFLRKVFPPLYFVLRLLSLVGGLVWALWMRVSSDVDCLLVQNPPAIPLLLISFIYCRFVEITTGKRPKFVIDWHNLGYSMLRDGSKFQKLAKGYEQQMAPLADGHLCVTKAMKNFLQTNLKVKKEISVLYDCPPSMFRPLSMDEQHQFLERLQTDNPSLRGCCWVKELADGQTLLTEQVQGKAAARSNRPILVTSSTSWTEDEDFGILLEALDLFDKKLFDMNLRMLVCVTGKGPMKDYYQEKISRLSLTNISIHTLWLAPGDYPKLLACADVGISLHTSTSGLDLPMKVLDLFGCETPVCAIGFDCLDELVQDHVNGRVFSKSQDLVSQLDNLLSEMPIIGAEPHSFGDLAIYSKNLKGRQRWSENWKANALSLLNTRDR